MEISPDDMYLKDKLHRLLTGIGERPKTVANSSNGFPG